MKVLKICLVVFFICMTSISAIATELPPPPDGYSWVNCNEIKGAFLMPLGWYFKKGQQGDTLGYFITKENIDENGEFLTGLSVNVIPNIPQKKGMVPSDYAATYIKTALSEREVLKRPWLTQMGPFEGHGIVLINRDYQKGDYITHNLAIANDQTGTIYIITFESPKKTWDTSWSIAEPMLQRFLIDDTI
jgi:hypothetical protein